MKMKKIENYDDFNSFKNENDGNLRIVKIGAEWCGPCRVMEKIIHEMEENLIENTVFAEIDIENDDMDQVTVEYSIRNIPVLLFFKNGEMVNKHVGSTNAEGIYNMINQYK